MSQALYKRLTADFLSKVQAGEIKVGDRLPPEAEYAEQLGVSRSTVRLAFAQLEENGIIKRAQRGGTKVISDKPVKRYQMVGGGLFDILGDEKLLSLVVTDVCNVGVESVDELEEWRSTSRVWLSCSAKQHVPSNGSTPLVIKSFVPEHYCDINVAVGDFIDPVFKLIEQRYEVSVGRLKKVTTAEKCSESVACAMGLNEGDPVLLDVIEIEDTQGRLMEITYLYFDTARFSIESEYRVRT